MNIAGHIPKCKLADALCFVQIWLAYDHTLGEYVPAGGSSEQQQQQQQVGKACYHIRATTYVCQAHVCTAVPYAYDCVRGVCKTTEMTTYLQPL